jgi:hypothetical protein
VQTQVLGALGDDPEEVPRDLDLRIRGFVQRRLKQGWEDAFWPDLMRVEQRFFAPFYAVGTTYAAGTVVFFEETQVYYQALKGFTASTTAFNPSISGVVNSTYWVAAQREYSATAYSPTTAYVLGNQVSYLGTVYQNILASTGLNPTNTANWTALVPFKRVVPYTGTGVTSLGTVLGCYNEDPRVHIAAGLQDWILTESGVEVRGTGVGVTAAASTFIEFRTAAPTLGTLTYDTNVIYPAGSRVLYTSALGVGNFYIAGAGLAAGQSPETNPSLWTLIEVPEFMERYLVQGAYADCLKADGHPEQWAMENDLALQLLGDQAGLLEEVSQQRRRVTVGQR